VNPMTTPTDAKIQEDRSARAALLVLRATVHDGALLKDAYLMLPSTNVLNRDEAVRWLVRLHKPVSCYASVRDGLLTVRCQPLPDALREARDKALPQLRGGLRSVVARAVDVASDPLILLRGGGESLLLHLSEFEQYLTDYRSVAASTFDTADEDARSMGAVAVWDVRPAGDWRSEGPEGLIVSGPPR
jgi:hypothetical protein